MANSLKELREVHVRDLDKECSYPTRPGGFAVEECCRQAADSVVIAPNGLRMYRCTKHAGKIDAGASGRQCDTVRTREDVPDSVVVSWPERT